MYFVPFLVLIVCKIVHANLIIIGLLKSCANVDFVLVKRCRLNLDLHCRLLLKYGARSREGLKKYLVQ